MKFHNERQASTIVPRLKQTLKIFRENLRFRAIKCTLSLSSSSQTLVLLNPSNHKHNPLLGIHRDAIPPDFEVLPAGTELYSPTPSYKRSLFLLFFFFLLDFFDFDGFLLVYAQILEFGMVAVVFFDEFMVLKITSSEVFGFELLWEDFKLQRFDFYGFSLIFTVCFHWRKQVHIGREMVAM